MQKLSTDLQPILDFELNRGNEIERIDSPAGTECPYCVVLKEPLNKQGIESALQLPASVAYWECQLPHYPMEAGYHSTISRHAISGPLQSSKRLSKLSK